MKSEGQKQSQKHEKRLAKLTGGQKNVASGAFWFRKGDVRAEDLLIEHKWTGKKSFTVQSSVLEKIMTEALIDSRTPVLGISMNNVNYVILDENDFLTMREFLIQCIEEHTEEK